MIRRPPRSTLFPTRRSSDLVLVHHFEKRQSCDIAARQRIALTGVGVAFEVDPVLRTGARFVLPRSEEHTSELQSQSNLVCRLLLEKKKNKRKQLVMSRKSQK